MTPPLDPRSVQFLQGFGAVGGGVSYVLRPTSEAEILEAFRVAQQTRRRVVVRGSGRSYGDPAFLAESIALDLSLMNEIEDLGDGVFRLEAGATLEQLWRFALPRNFWLPVVSGTAKPTIGGALAANIHGKNAFKAGTLGEHVTEMGVVFPNGESRTLVPSDELFWAVIGGMGLLGVFTWVKLRMHPVESDSLCVRSLSLRNWDEQFSAFSEHRERADYMVSWLDMGRSGRGLFHWATYESAGTPMMGASYDQEFRPKPLITKVLRLFNNSLGMRCINSAKYWEGRIRHQRKTFKQTLPDFQFLLDQLPGWEQMYAPRGFYQVQVFVPAAGAVHAFPAIERLCREHGQLPNLAVMKLHQATPHVLSTCAEEAYSLALDFRNQGERTVALGSAILDVALEHRGKTYLAKDQLATPRQFVQSVHPDHLATFARFKQWADPDRILGSAQSERLSL